MILPADYSGCTGASRNWQGSRNRVTFWRSRTSSLFFKLHSLRSDPGALGLGSRILLGRTVDRPFEITPRYRFTLSGHSIHQLFGRSYSPRFTLDAQRQLPSFPSNIQHTPPPLPYSPDFEPTISPLTNCLASANEQKQNHVGLHAAAGQQLSFASQHQRPRWCCQ